MKNNGFSELIGYWTPVLPAADIPADVPVGTELAGERVVLFRDAEGHLAGLVDRCPHRGVKLSLGKVQGGCLTCPFHGWRFDRSGACTRVPFNPGVERGRHAAVLSVVEAADLAWVYLGDGEPAGLPPVPPNMVRPSVGRSVVQETWSAHWTRAMENMLDTPHLPFVHRGTIGAGMARRMTADSRMEQEIVDSESGFEIRFRLDGDPGQGSLAWLRPNAMELTILDEPGRSMRQFAYCVPLDAQRTRMIVVSAYEFGWMTPLMKLGGFYNRKILGEDRAVLESSSPEEVPELADEQHVPTDKATLLFRRWYLEERERLRGVSPAAPTENGAPR